MQALVVALGLGAYDLTAIDSEMVYTVNNEDQYIVLDSSEFDNVGDIHPRYIEAYAHGRTFYVERIA